MTGADVSIAPGWKPGCGTSASTPLVSHGAMIALPLILSPARLLGWNVLSGVFGPSASPHQLLVASTVALVAVSKPAFPLPAMLFLLIAMLPLVTTTVLSIYSPSLVLFWMKLLWMEIP